MEGQRIPNLNVNSMSKVKKYKPGSNEALYDPINTKSKESLDLAKSNMARKMASVPKPRHPVKDPSMTTRRFFHQSKVDSGRLSLRQFYNS